MSTVQFAQALCPVKGCELPIRVGRYCCDSHWDRLPAPLKERIARTKTEYTRASRVALAWLEEHLEKPDAVDID